MPREPLPGEWKNPYLVLVLLIAGLIALQWFIGTHPALWTY